jgi:hypothetical protein
VDYVARFQRCLIRIRNSVRSFLKRVKYTYEVITLCVCVSIWNFVNS